jgi:Uma2 family endonuclease
MSMPAMRPVSTIEELWDLPEDGQRHELLDGVHVVTPSPTYGHQRVVSRLLAALFRATEDRPDLQVLTSPADLRLGPHTAVQPDLFVCRVDQASPPRSWPDLGTPILAIEILSPATASRDRGTKRRTYQQAGVSEYWVVDPDARLIERWTPSDARPEIVDEALEWRVDEVVLLELRLTLVFGEPTGA